MSPVVALRWSRIGAHAHGGDGALDEALLDAGERRRAATIRHPGARRRFIIAHAALRRLLADVLGGAPDAFRITADRVGKPRLIDDEGWSISLAHTHDAVVVATAHGVEVGVDVERLDRVRLPPLERWCTSAEVSACRAGEATAQPLAVRLWTGKEALVKAAGLGLRMPFRDCDVLQTEVPGPRSSAHHDEPITGTVRWLELSPRHAIALATLGGAGGPQADRRQAVRGALDGARLATRLW